MRFIPGGRAILAAATKARLGFLRQQARLAQRRKDWPAATNLWRKSLQIAPDDRSAMAGYIGSLIHAGEIEEASVQAKAFAERHPTDENGPITLARIAEARGDMQAAMEFWRLALERRPDHLQALIRLGTAQISAGKFEEAAKIARRLVSRYPAEPHGFILQAQIAQQESGFDSASGLWHTAAERFDSNIHFLRAYGRALIGAGQNEHGLKIADRIRAFDIAESWRLRGQVLAREQPYRDQTPFWSAASAELPDNSDITRKLLHAALWARREDKAVAAFDRLLDQRRLNASDADYLVGVAHAYLEAKNPAEARHLVRRFMRGMRGRFGYRAAALRLDRLTLSSFPSRSEFAVALSGETERFLTIVRRADMSPDARNTLERVAMLEAHLRTSGASCLFETDISAESCRAFVQIVRERIEQRQPLAFIRLGDGESNALDYEAAFADRFEADAAAREKIWWGRALDPQIRSQLARRVHAAIENADGLGIPLRGRVLRDIRLTPGLPLSATTSGRGLLSVLRLLEERQETGGLANRVLSSAHIHQDLERWDLYGELFSGKQEVVLVSCHQGLPEAMQRTFGATVAKLIVTPPGDAALEMQGRSLGDDDVPPNSLKRALDELGEWPRGRLVLVGAGYAGKIIVDEARQRGGVALDLGSIFDHWMGLNTRSYQDLA